MIFYRTCGGNADECLSLTPVHLELEVISLKPKAFIIQNFLNDFECSEIIRLASSSLKHSIVGDVDAGAFESDTRTSKNTWLPRRKSAVTDTLYRRAADLLQIDENLLHPSKAAEDMQVVHYVNGQKYDSHHDWGVSGYPESRYITLLLYLNDMVSVDAGGETAFPKAADGKGIKVHPGKGSAVLFYNLLEDGNGDDLSLHAALPIKKGEKWLANFWVWDPKRK
jgi:prolyl 4-hydroxylase